MRDRRHSKFPATNAFFKQPSAIYCHDGRA
jgi:hypothetical protein